MEQGLDNNDQARHSTIGRYRMSDSIVANLLGSVPRGEEIRDPREGDHPDAVLQAAELVQNKTGSWAVIATFGNVRDSDGKAFEHKERFNIPGKTSDIAVKRIFLSTLHDLEIVPRESKQAVYAETDEHREAIAQAFKEKGGTNVPLRLKPKGDGFLRASIIRTRR